VLRAPPMRTCIGQANNALGNPRRAAELFAGVARELGPATPPLLYVMLARTNLGLGELDRCQEWLARARTAAASDPSLQPKVRELATALRRARRQRAGASRAPTDPRARSD
jgi:hypothetical protein